MLENIPSNNILNPASNYIVCPTWTILKAKDQYLMNIFKYFQAFVRNMFFGPHYVSVNSIGENI